MPQNFITPELIQLLSEAGVIPDRRSDLDQQVAYAQSLRKNPTQFSGTGGYLGAIGNMLNAWTAKRTQDKAMGQKQQLLDKLAQIGGQYGQAYANQGGGLPGLMGMPSQMQGLTPPWRGPPMPNPYGLEET